MLMQLQSLHLFQRLQKLQQQLLLLRLLLLLLSRVRLLTDTLVLVGQHVLASWQPKLTFPRPATTLRQPSQGVSRQ